MAKRERAPAPEATISGDHADDHRRRRHQDRAQAHRRRLARSPSRRDRPSRLLQPVGEIDHQDAVLGDQADQRHQADLRIDVDAGEAEHAADVERQQRAEQRRRQRDQDDERIAEALVLRGEHEIDDDQREDEDVDERVAFLLELARVALEIVADSPSGKISCDFALRKSSASPSVRPGNGTPDSVAELSCWKLVSALGCTFSETLATADSGTSSPLRGAQLVARQPIRASGGIRAAPAG